MDFYGGRGEGGGGLNACAGMFVAFCKTQVHVPILNIHRDFEKLNKNNLNLIICILKHGLCSNYHKLL